MANISVNVWLYGQLARYVDEKSPYGSASRQVSLPQGSTIRDLLAYLGIPTEERGITFINGRLSAMPGLQADMDYVLDNNDRVACFDLKSMWPFQYRHGAMMTDEMTRTLHAREGTELHHTYSGQ